MAQDQFTLTDALASLHDAARHWEEAREAHRKGNPEDAWNRANSAIRRVGIAYSIIESLNDAESGDDKHEVGEHSEGITADAVDEAPLNGALSPPSALKGMLS